MPLTVKFDLGVMNQRGLEGVLSQNQEEALKHFSRAADLGYVKAQHNLAMHFSDTQDYGSAVKYFKLAADQGKRSSYLLNARSRLGT